MDRLSEKAALTFSLLLPFSVVGRGVGLWWGGWGVGVRVEVGTALSEGVGSSKNIPLLDMLIHFTFEKK